MKQKLISLLIVISIATMFTGCGKQGADNLKTLSTKGGSTSNNYYFSRDNGAPDKQLIKVIKTSTKSLDVSIYSLTKTDIVDSIIDAKRRGVCIRIITDKQESQSRSESKQLYKLKAAGIPIKVNSHSGLMHEKITIVDKNVVTTGSFNYTESATTKNDEVLVVIHNSMDAQQFEKEFERMWNDTSNFREY